MSSFHERIIGAAKLDIHVFEEVENDLIIPGTRFSVNTPSRMDLFVPGSPKY